MGPKGGSAAAASMWGLLHGMWAPRQAGVLGGKKPARIDGHAFEAIIRELRR